MNNLLFSKLNFFIKDEPCLQEMSTDPDPKNKFWGSFKNYKYSLDGGHIFDMIPLISEKIHPSFWKLTNKVNQGDLKIFRQLIWRDGLFIIIYILCKTRSQYGHFLHFSSEI